MVLSRTLLTFVKTLGVASVLFYFSYHMVSGEKGVLSMIQLEQKLAAAKQDHATIRLEREYIERRVELMYTTSLDADLLDEQARRNLGHAAPDEIVYMPSVTR